MTRAPEQPAPRDLPVLLWAVFPPVMLVLLVVLALTARPTFLAMMAKDHEGGLVEHATVVLLLPAIAAGLVIFFRYGKGLPSRWLRWWILMWTLACVYFAGEEISWGQWIFGWETPEAMKEMNLQDETNLHNLSAWLYQKPKSLVELWILVAGILLPVIRAIRKKVPDTARFRYWLLPTCVCVPVAVLASSIRFFRYLEDAVPSMPHLERLGSGELREYYVALFLMIYMLSFWLRARNERAAVSPPAPAAGEARASGAS